MTSEATPHPVTERPRARPGAPAPDITVEIKGKRVRKIFHVRTGDAGSAKAKFARELAAYRRLGALGADFVPGLLDWDEEGLWLETDLVAGGRTMLDWLEAAPSNSFEPVVAQLIMIDRFFYENRINYMDTSPKDILVADDFRLYVVDFESTFLDEDFQQVLYDRIFHPRLIYVRDDRTRDAFLAFLANRRDDFHRFLPRKIRNGVLARLGLLRKTRRKAR